MLGWKVGTSVGHKWIRRMPRDEIEFEGRLRNFDLNGDGGLGRALEGAERLRHELFDALERVLSAVRQLWCDGVSCRVQQGGQGPQLRTVKGPRLRRWLGCGLETEP